EGETGTGKEQVARAIHQAAQSRTGPLVAVNCAALPETLLESELFGHEKGAFTNAVGMRSGRFELANGGTLFLDQVGDITAYFHTADGETPPPMHTKCHRCLQYRPSNSSGGTEIFGGASPVIPPTNLSLQRLVKKGDFREDLFYRLNVVKIALPPLRERVEDI